MYSIVCIEYTLPFGNLQKNFCKKRLTKKESIWYRFGTMPKKSKEIGIKIRSARQKAKLSRRDLMLSLRVLGIDVVEATIFNWEKGESIPTAEKLPVLAQALSVRPEFFLIKNES